MPIKDAALISTPEREIYLGASARNPHQVVLAWPFGDPNARAHTHALIHLHTPLVRSALMVRQDFNFGPFSTRSLNPHVVTRRFADAPLAHAHQVRYLIRA